MMAPTVMGAPGHESDPRLNLRVWCNLESTPPKLSRGEAREFNSLTRTETDRLLVLAGKRTDENDPLSNNLTVRDIDGCVSPKGTGVAVPIHTAIPARFATFHAVPPIPLRQPSLCGGVGAFLCTKTIK